MRDTKTITVNMDKGGTGKTSIAYNLAKWLSGVLHSNVLLIDGDESCNMTRPFGTYNLGESSVEDIFLKKEVEIYHIEENLDFIRGSKGLNDENLNLASKQNNCLIMFMWIYNNQELLSKYDYIIIDTHNDTSRVTYNFLAVADIVLGVTDPSVDGYIAWDELVETIELLKRELVTLPSNESLVTAEPYLLANKVYHIGRSSKQFLESVEVEGNYIGMIQRKELIASSLPEGQSIFEMRDKMGATEKKKHQKFYENVEAIFNRIINLAGGEENA
ncbi:ParA family protein [Enterococcus faecium]|jgi:chromosome partitioning protein|uniref:ParA family protein n=1 Tax=Enterococcus faecium TaxID=1352 RepID=UPI001F1B3C06|nr:ParA family protein [Enterococcus faecium]EKZ0201725.1 ParA family protein [Enterococcus faecalis]MCF8636742.1 ParA family protein [Enterococcus faecium]HAQ5747073.1 ParA family protein [Enterococcus faecium]